MAETPIAPAPPLPPAADRTVGTGSEGQSQALVKRMLPRSLFGRALIIIVLPLILTQIITTFVFFERHFETVNRRLADGVAGDVQTILFYYQTQPDWRSETLAIAEAAMQLQVKVEKGARLETVTTLDDAETAIERTLLRTLQHRIAKPLYLRVDYYERWATIDVQLPDGVMRITAPRERLFNATTLIFLFWMLGSATILLAIAVIFMRNQIRPIHRLAEAADSFGRGIEVASFRPEGGSEVRRAAVAFNRMRERIRRQLAQRTEMLAGVSHDLRTPLTRMKLQLAFLGDRPEAEGLKADIADMELMIEAYLAFARGEGGERAVATDLTALLAELVDATRRGGGTVHLDADPGLALTIRPNAVKRALANLVANGLRYGGRAVWVTARATPDHVEITVDDDGPGIPESEREIVFRPFFRREASRNLATGGIGLGLTIARDIVRGHGGELVLAAAPQGGLRAELRLPV
ncbi:MAG: HAMP domain-containing protein [Alphaproteobacteria bacterium]|nr:HAMP domain-containing protein [Alphaproteobacteria bacterium]